LSESQAALARERIARDGVADRCSVDVRDCRALPADLTFDKVVSVGMFEHVGRAQLELPVGEEGHTSALAHTRDRMGDFPSVAFWNWSQPSMDWFNLATGEALAEYTPSPVMRELVAGVESQRADPHLSASTGGIAHITHSTTSNSRVNATQPRVTRALTPLNHEKLAHLHE
jgi:hypothetical protein